MGIGQPTVCVCVICSTGLCPHLNQVEVEGSHCCHEHSGGRSYVEPVACGVRLLWSLSSIFFPIRIIPQDKTGYEQLETWHILQCVGGYKKPGTYQTIGKAALGTFPCMGRVCHGFLGTHAVLQRLVSQPLLLFGGWGWIGASCALCLGGQIWIWGYIGLFLVSQAGQLALQVPRSAGAN